MKRQSSTRVKKTPQKVSCDDSDDFVKQPPSSGKHKAQKVKCYSRFSGERMLPRCALNNLTGWFETFTKEQW